MNCYHIFSFSVTVCGLLRWTVLCWEV